MNFVDRVKLTIKAGNGGNGAIAFLREKFRAKGGPAGGDGGRGGSIFFISDSGLTTLLDLQFRRSIEAESGSAGANKNQYGKAAEDVYIKVPVGTVVTNAVTKRIVADFKEPNETKLIAKGGRGGRGNAKFATSVNQVPRIAENGEPGEEFEAIIELKLLADVGLVGLPSVGKSSLISVVSGARPKIADYHFTTLIPNLGVVKVPNGDSFVMADLPGLIEGASEGAGLGLQFLRHIERCKVLVHVLDMAQVEERDVINDYETINNELAKYKAILLDKPMIVVANKMDIDGANENLKRFKEKYKNMEVFEISTIERKGLDKLIYRLNEIVKTTVDTSLVEENNEHSYILKDKEDKGFVITHPEQNLWVISGERVEKLYHMTNISDDQGLMYLLHTLRTMGVDDELENLGVKDGDTVRLCDFEFEYYD